jgi:periplasmic protein TonB
VSSVPIASTPVPGTVERRSHPRKRLDQLAYIGFGPDTGGVLLDISEEGLRCQIVGSVVEGHRCRLKFALPGRHSAIEADGQVVWSNSSKQGGGVRLLHLGQHVRRDLQQWINDEISSPNVKGSAPAPLRTKSVGAVHVPKPSEPDVALPASAAAMPAATAEAASSSEPHSPIEPEIRTAAEVPESIHALPETETVPAAPQTPAAEEPVAPPAKLHPAVPPNLRAAVVPKAAWQLRDPHPVMPLTVSRVEHRTGRFALITVLAGCVAAGVVAIALSGFDPTDVLSSRDIPANIAVVAPPVPPALTALALQDVAEQPVESAGPTDASDVPDPLSSSEKQIARPEAAGTGTVPVSRPAQTPQTVAPAKRQRLALVAPRPRATRPAPPAAVPPETSITLPSLPAPLLDMPLLENRSLEPPQPVRPPTVAEYRPPQLLSQVAPVYSAMARQTRLQGTVKVNATVGIDGLPHALVCVDGNSLLCRMALDAIAKWRYRPAASNGKPVDAQTLINFNFQLR